MDLGLKSKVAIVTGAAQGMGKDIALGFVKEQALPIIWDINGEEATKAANEIRELGQDCISFEVDVTSFSQIQEAVKQIVKKYNRIDILVNNAGICFRRGFEEISAEEWDKVMSVNLKGTFLCSKAIVPIMKKERSGKIINISSAAGKTGGVAAGAHYSASKAGVICLTKSLARGLAPYNINVNALAPAFIETKMLDSMSPQQIESCKKIIPLGRMGTCQDVTLAVLFLASERANFITGEISNVSGGLVMD